MRVKKAFRNSILSMMAQIILIVFGFFSQRVMNLRLGEELIGMNSVISNIIALLSVSELGIATAVVYHLYSALAREDEKRIASLMNLYRKAYGIFATVISCLGLFLLPFIHIFLKDNNFTLSYIRTIYLLWLVKTVLSYLLSYKRSILIADQKEYIVSIGTLLANAMNYVLIIVIVEIWQNYVFALTLNVVVEAVMNIVISCYVDKKYTYLVKYKKEPLERNIIKKIMGDIKNIFATQLSSKILISTDSLIMSSFINVRIVGLYSNYTMITQSLINIILACSNAIQPSLGNLFVEKNHEKEYTVLRQISFLFFLGASFVAVCLFALMKPFVTDIWLTEEYALSFDIIFWCIVILYTRTLGLPLTMMMNVSGLFKKERNLAITVAILNLSVSLALVFKLQVVGVLLGTFVSYLVENLYRMKVLIKEYMNKELKTYFLEMIQYILFTIVEVGLVCWLKELIYQNASWLSFIILMIICVIVPNGLNILIFHRTWRFKSVWMVFLNLMNRKKAVVE